MDRKANEQLSLDFDPHSDHESSEVTMEVSGEDLGTVDYSLVNRLNRKELEKKREIYEGIHSLVKHLC